MYSGPELKTCTEFIRTTKVSVEQEYQLISYGFFFFPGTESLISKHHSLLQECESDENDDAVCNKDTGKSQRSLRKWSRGLLHFVRGRGHIERWCPLYV